MNLGFRPFQSNETLILQVPNSTTLPQLLEILSKHLPKKPSPASIRLSLNRKDDIPSDGAGSLQSVGISTGDLIYFATAPNPQNTVTEPNEKLFAQVADNVTGFLRDVFAEELAGHDGRDHKLTVVAVHAVMVQSGFVGFDSDGFELRKEWPSGLFRLSLSYTLPGQSAGEGVVLKFQSLGNYLCVYGALVRGGQHFGVRLNEYELGPFLNAVWAGCGVKENIRGKNGETLRRSPEEEVCRFWRSVKGNLAVPLMDDLRVEAGWDVPPYFTRLPSDLKWKIMEALPAADMAKARCVCSELRDVELSEERWKVKCREELRVDRKQEPETWRTTYLRAPQAMRLFLKLWRIGTF